MPDFTFAKPALPIVIDDSDDDLPLPPPKRQRSASVASTSSVTSTTSNASASSSKSTNIGGSSKLEWVNQFISIPAMASILKHLKSKISNITVQRNGCHHITNFTKDTRPVCDTRFHSLIAKHCPTCPKRFSPYTIAMMAAGIRVPDRDPPSLPESLRKVTQKRSSDAKDGNDKGATWVCSHLCHDPRCSNVAHLRWEPSWFNRLRDNCPGGAACLHRPDPCLNPHRSAEDIIDWTSYWV